MKAVWNFTIPSGKAQAGDTMTVDIPSVLTVASSVSFDIKDQAGNVIGTGVANPETNKLTITLTSQVTADHNDISGEFNIWVKWNTDKVQQNTTVTVDWGNASGTTTVTIPDSEGPDPNETLLKWAG